jgi:hypothetical protein
MVDSKYRGGLLPPGPEPPGLLSQAGDTGSIPYFNMQMPNRCSLQPLIKDLHLK